MSTTQKEPMLTKVVIGPVRFSYAYVFQSKYNEQSGKNQYSIAILIPKSSKAIIKQIEAGIEAAKKLGKEKNWKGKVPSSLKNPLRDGDEERTENPEYKGMYFIGANSMQRPAVVSKQKDDEGKFIPITDEEDFYSGCWGNVSINFFPYDQKGNKGIGAGLLNLQKTKDDERLSGKSSAEEDFKSDNDDEEEDEEEEDEEENPFA